MTHEYSPITYRPFPHDLQSQQVRSDAILSFNSTLEIGIFMLPLEG